MKNTTGFSVARITGRKFSTAKKENNLRRIKQTIKRSIIYRFIVLLLLHKSFVVESLQLLDLLVLLLEHARLDLVDLADHPEHGGFLHLGLGSLSPAVLVGFHLHILAFRKFFVCVTSRAVEAVDPDPIRMFLGLLDPDPLVRCTDPAPAPDPSIIKQK